MGIPDHLTCLLRSLYAEQEAAVRSGRGTIGWFKVEEGDGKVFCCHPTYLNYMQNTSCEIRAGWLTSWNQDCQEKYQQPQICRWYHLNGRNWRETKEPVDEGEREEWKSWLKTQHSKKEDHGIWSHHFMTNRWGKSQNSDWFSFWGPQITVDSDCSCKIKRCLLLGRKSVTNLDSILKSTDITLLTKVCIVKTMVFPVEMYGSECWTIKKVKHQRIDAFKLWCWRGFLRVPWTARWSTSQS